MSDHDEVKYTDEFVTKLELVFGTGFLSPGGIEEVAKIVEGIDFKDKVVLDIGVGVAGPASLLVENHGANHVTGIDLEKPVLQKAAKTVAPRNLDDHITLKHAKPGALPFDDASFDMVFSKDSIIHVPDKSALFKEALRVLKPGGWVVMSDWCCGDEPPTREMQDWLTSNGLGFVMTPISKGEALLGDAGFADYAVLDRNEWFAGFSKALFERMSGPEYAAMVSVLGQEEADNWLGRTETWSVLLKQGQIRPGHLRGRRPV